MTRRSRLALLALPLAGAAAITAAAMQREPARETIDTTALQPTFVEDFNGAALDSRKWTQGPGSDRVDQRTLSGNAERQVYFNPGWLGLTTQPVSIANGVLKIQAQPMTPSERAAVAHAVTTLPPQNASPAFANLAYSSGRITTLGRFAQRYGYFEVRARFSGGQGLWPALWLLPADGGWPPEIDIMESLGHKPQEVISTIHSAAAPKQDKWTNLTPTDDGFHRYGVMWGPETIESYVDGAKTASFKTPPDAHKPMYFIANLAVGGNWPGVPDASTRFPATLEIDSVRVWKWPGSKKK